MCLSVPTQMSEKKPLLFSQVVPPHSTHSNVPPAAAFSGLTGEQGQPWKAKMYFFLNSHCTLYMAGRWSRSGFNHLSLWFSGGTAWGTRSLCPDGWIQPTVLTPLAQLLVTGVFSALLLDTFSVRVTAPCRRNPIWKAPTTSAASFLAEECQRPDSPLQLFNPMPTWQKRNKWTEL